MVCINLCTSISLPCITVTIFCLVEFRDGFEASIYKAKASGPRGQGHDSLSRTVNEDPIPGGIAVN